MSAEVTTSGASNRPLPLRFRPDLRWAQVNPGQAAACVQDPLTLRYFQLGPYEQFVLRQLDGRTTLAELCTRFAAQFGPLQLDPGTAHQFIARLWEQGLLLWEPAGRSGRQPARMPGSLKRGGGEWWLHPLSIRLPGWNPDRWLSSVAPALGWLTHWFTVLMWGLFVLSAIGLVLLNPTEVARRWEPVAAWLTPTGLIWLAVVLALVKLLHELGHAIFCKLVGGHVPELGVMLLCGTPTLYCDVTDLWQIPQRSSRFLVTGAGMLVELTLAAAATWIWWSTAPGLVHSLAAQVIVVCGVGTLLFNANPLLRYDGYFLLADALGVPNLADRAQQAVQFTWAWLCGAAPTTVDPPPRWLVLFGWGSLVYRWLLLAFILKFMTDWLVDLGWPSVAGGVLLLTLVGVAVGPLRQLSRSVTDEQTRRRWLRGPVLVRVSLLGLLLAGVLLVPLPRWIVSQGMIEARGAQPVFVRKAGLLTAPVPAAGRVAEQTPLLVLADPVLTRELLRIQGEIVQIRRQIEVAEQQRLDAPQAGQRLPALRTSLFELERLLKDQQQVAGELQLVSPRRGQWFPAVRSETPTEQDELTAWSGSLSETANAGAWIEAGTLVGWVADPDAWMVTMYVDEREVPLLHSGQAVQWLAHEDPGQWCVGEVDQVGQRPTQDLSMDWLLRLGLPVDVTARSQSHALAGQWYPVRLRVTGANRTELWHGGAADVWVQVGARSLGSAIVQHLQDWWEQ